MTVLHNGALIACLLAVAALAQAQDGGDGVSRPRLSDERVVLHTDAGDIVVAFYPDVAPLHMAQLLKLMRLGAYDTTHFYRVDPGYLVQLSDVTDRIVPLTGEQAAAIRLIPGEFSSRAHRLGMLSMARMVGDPNSAETSFSILLADAPHLDGQFTVVGEVVDGIDALMQLAAVETNARNAPLVRVQLRATTVVDTPNAVPSLAAARPVVVPDYVRSRAQRERAEPLARHLHVQPGPVSASSSCSASPASWLRIDASSDYSAPLPTRYPRELLRVVHRLRSTSRPRSVDRRHSLSWRPGTLSTHGLVRSIESLTPRNDHGRLTE